MSTLLDFLDDFVLGPLNLLDRIEGWVDAFCYRDYGYELAIPRTDKGGSFSLDDIRRLLIGYGVVTYGRRFDSRNMYIRVKRRQACWAEYVLLHAGVELLNPVFDQRNAGYVAGHAQGWMPRPWSAGRAAQSRAAVNGERTKATKRDRDKGLLAWLESL